MQNASEVALICCKIHSYAIKNIVQTTFLDNILAMDMDSTWTRIYISIWHMEVKNAETVKSHQVEKNILLTYFGKKQCRTVKDILIRISINEPSNKF